MEDSDQNHASFLPYPNTYPFAPNTSEPPNYVQVVWGYNYESKSSALERDNPVTTSGNTWQMIDSGTSTNPTNFRVQLLTSNTSDGNRGYVYNEQGSVIDSYSTSVYGGQGIVGDMSNYAHIFEIFKYKVTSTTNVSQSFSGGTADIKIGIEAIGDFASTTERQTKEDASLDLFSEYFSQPSNSIWRDSSGNWGLQ